MIHLKNSKIYKANNYISKNITSSNYFRVVHICKNAEIYEKLYSFMKINWVLLWTSWSEKNIAPKNTSLNKAWYTIWSCPKAENIASRIVFLPNAYNRKSGEIEKVNKLLDKFYNKNV